VARVIYNHGPRARPSGPITPYVLVISRMDRSHFTNNGYSGSGHRSVAVKQAPLSWRMDGDSHNPSGQVASPEQNRSWSVCVVVSVVSHGPRSCGTFNLQHSTHTTRNASVHQQCARGARCSYGDAQMGSGSEAVSGCTSGSGEHAGEVLIVAAWGAAPIRRSANYQPSSWNDASMESLAAGSECDRNPVRLP
jgi:hypothetical protein